MRTTTIIARDSRAALEEIARQLGPDALVIETRRHPRGVEVVAGVEPYAQRPSPHPVPSHRGEGTPPLQRGEQSLPLGWGRSGGGDTAGESAPSPDAEFAAAARDIGLAEALIARIDRAGLADAADAWARFLQLLDASVPIAEPPHRTPRHLCVVGGSGTGKTTVLAQIAARLRRDEPGCCIAFVAADAARAGAEAQLRLIAEQLGVPVVALADAAPAAVATRLLIDMPSDVFAAREAAQALKALDGGLHTLCTMPLTAQLARHRQMLRHFDGTLDSLVVTHAGEPLPPGGLISALAEARLPLAYLSRDAAPAGAIEPARPSALYRLIVAALSGASGALQ